MWENCESVYLPTNLQLGCKRTVSTYLPSWRMGELWFYLHTYQTSRRIERILRLHTQSSYLQRKKCGWLPRMHLHNYIQGEWESVPCYLSSGDMRELWVYLPFLPAFKGDVRKPCLNLSIFEEIRKNFWVYLPNYLPTFKEWENCESHTYLSTPFMDVRKLWVYFTYQPSVGMWESCIFLSTNLSKGMERNCVFLPIYLPTTFTVHSHPPLKVDSQVSHMLFWGMWETWVPPSLPTFEWEVKELGFCLYLPIFSSGYVRELSLPTHIPIFWGECERTLSPLLLSTHLHS